MKKNLLVILVALLFNGVVFGQDLSKYLSLKTDITKYYVVQDNSTSDPKYNTYTWFRTIFKIMEDDSLGAVQIMIKRGKFSRYEKNINTLTNKDIRYSTIDTWFQLKDGSVYTPDLDCLIFPSECPSEFIQKDYQYTAKFVDKVVISSQTYIDCLEFIIKGQGKVSIFMYAKDIGLIQYGVYNVNLNELELKENYIGEK